MVATVVVKRDTGPKTVPSTHQEEVAVVEVGMIDAEVGEVVGDTVSVTTTTIDQPIPENLMVTVAMHMTTPTMMTTIVALCLHLVTATDLMMTLTHDLDAHLRIRTMTGIPTVAHPLTTTDEALQGILTMMHTNEIPTRHGRICGD